MGGDAGGSGEHVPTIIGQGQHTGCPLNNLPPNDHVLVLNFNYAFQIRSRRHFCTYNRSIFFWSLRSHIICSRTFKIMAPPLFVFRPIV